MITTYRQYEVHGEALSLSASGQRCQFPCLGVDAQEAFLDAVARYLDCRLETQKLQVTAWYTLLGPKDVLRAYYVATWTL